MKQMVVFAVVIIFSLAMLSCVRKVYVPVAAHRSEVVVVRDTVVEVVTAGEMYKNSTTDTVSVLSCDRAYSVAQIAQGVLSHTLSIQPRRDSVVLRWREVHTTDSVPYLVPVPGERVEVIPSWMWCVTGVLLIMALSLLLLYRWRV